MKTQKIDHTAEAVGKLTPDYEISCSLLEPLITGENPYQTRNQVLENCHNCLLYTSPSPRDDVISRMPSSA